MSSSYTRVTSHSSLAVLLAPLEQRGLGRRARGVSADLEAARLEDLLDGAVRGHLRDFSFGDDGCFVSRARLVELGPEPALDPLHVVLVDDCELAAVG